MPKHQHNTTDVPSQRKKLHSINLDWWLVAIFCILAIAAVTLSSLRPGEGIPAVPQSSQTVTSQVESSQAGQDADEVEANRILSLAMEPDGGATWNPKNKTLVKQGFAISPFPERSVSIPANELREDDIQNYLDRNDDLLSQSGHHLGIWHDPKTDTIFLDISVVVDDVEEAKALCKKYDQVAFFDFQTMESVDVDRTATSGGAAKPEPNSQPSPTTTKS